MTTLSVNYCHCRSSESGSKNRADQWDHFFSKIYYPNETCTLQLLLFAQNYWAEINFPCLFKKERKGEGGGAICILPSASARLAFESSAAAIISQQQISLSFSLFILPPPLLFTTSAKSVSQSVSLSPALESWPAAAQEWRRHLSWPSKHTDAVAAAAAAVKSCRERLQRWI